MTQVDPGLFDEVTDDTTSSGSVAIRVFHVSSVRAPLANWVRQGLRARDEQSLLTVLVSSWGAAGLGAAHERAAILRRFEEVSTDVTSWEFHEESMTGLAGVVAVPRHRKEIFRMTIDISPGKLPRRTPRFAFLDTRELQDDD